MKTKKCSLSMIVLIALSLILTTNPCHAYFGENSSQAPSGHKMAAIIAGSAVAGIAGLVLAFGNFFGKNSPSKDTVTYNPNGADSGTVPVDPNVYDDGATPKVLDNPGELKKTGFKHIGWSDVPDATKAQYTTGENMESLSGPKNLYAVYGASITYKDTSGATGAPPVDDGQYTEGFPAIVLDQGTLSKNNYFFQGWSLTDGALAPDYRPGDTIIIPVTGDLTLYSVWSIKPYRVNYYANGATAGSVPIDAQYYNSGEAATILGNTGNLVKTGFHFLGWSINSNASVPEYIAGSLATIPSASLKLYAVWTCNITYNANSNSTNGSVPIDSNNYINGSLAPIASQGNLTNQGYYFKNWSNNSSASVGNYIPGTNTTMTGDLTLFAIWNQKPYSVTYYPNGATSGDVPVGTTYYDINEVAKAHGNDAPVPLANPGFSFLGWSNNPNAASPQYVAGDNISFANATNGIVDLFAVWVCKIAYDSNGGSGNVTSDPINYIRNSTAILSNGIGITKPNYHISGWTNDNTSNNYNLSQSIIMSGNLYLTANWTLNSLNITYDINNETGNVTGSAPVDPTLYNTGDNATILSPVFLANPGFNNFSGWSTDNNSAIVQYSSTGLNNSSNKIKFGLDNITLYAVWNCGITYHGNGNTNGTVPVDNNSYAFDDSATIQGPNNLTRDNYLFSGWVDANYNELAPGDIITVGGNTDLYAQWILKPYSITYNDGGDIKHTNGTLPVDNGSYDTNDVARILNSNHPLVYIPEAGDPGYIFMGWSTESIPTTQVQYSYNGSYNGSSNITFSYDNINLNAVWGGKLTYNASGATGDVPLDNATYVVNSTAVVKDKNTLNMSNAYFHGWSDNPSPSQEVDYLPGDKISINGNKTIYAVWDPNQWFVFYDANAPIDEVYGNPPIDSGSYNTGDIAKVLNNTGSAPLIYINHRFLGWDTNANGTVNDSEYYAPGANLTIGNNSPTLYALWNTSQIQYFGNNNTGVMGVSTNDAAIYSNNDTVNLKNSTYIKNDRTFQGWDFNPNATNATYQPNGTFNFTYDAYHDNSTGIYKFYAIWGCGVTYNANGGNCTLPPNSPVYAANSTVTIGAPTSCTKNGLPFVGWGNSSNAPSIAYLANTSIIINSSLNLYALYGYTVGYTDSSNNTAFCVGNSIMNGSSESVASCSTNSTAYGAHGLMMNSADLGVFSWGNLSSVGANSFYDGLANTAKIIAKSTAPNAASVCDALGSGVWYLPAYNELLKMKRYATNNTPGGNGCASGGGRGNFACAGIEPALNQSGFYWSSSEIGSLQGRVTNLNGTIDDGSFYKTEHFSARPVKRF